MKIGRMVLLAVGIEALAVLGLIVAVALFGPAEPAAAQVYAERVGYWFGPAAGLVLCVGGGWLVSRHLPAGHVSRGLLLGAFVAAIDVALLVAGGAEFQPILVVSNLGRMAAGALGGWIASRTRPTVRDPSAA